MTILKKAKEKDSKNKLTENEPYYDSSDCDSFQSYEEEPISDVNLKEGF